MNTFSNSPVPVKAPPSLAKSRVGGALLIVLSLGMAYLFVWQPLQQARAAASFSYSMKGVLLTPAFLYTGVAVMMTDLRDGQAFAIGPDGKKHATRKGWIFIAGLLLVEVIALTLWSFYLKSLGYSVLG